MDLLGKIREHIAENDIPSALAELEKDVLTKNQKDDVLHFKQRYHQIRKDDLQETATQEEIRTRHNKLSLEILEFTEAIENGTYEVKPEKTFKETIVQTSPKYLLFAILLLEIIIGVLGELMPDEIKPILEELVGKENYWIAWIIVFVLTIALFLHLTFRKEKPKSTDVETNLLENEIEQIQQNLITRYNNRLVQKTDERLPIDLKLTYTKEGTSDSYFQKHFDKITINNSIQEDWITTLKKHEHILIVGKPGAGKSTQLLELAVAWLKEESCTQIPIVFNLAPWTSEDKHFHEWLASALVSGYGFSKALAKEAIENNRILPLLDGLDEVGTKESTDEAKSVLRSHCLNAIDRYLSLFDLPYITICSRINEYKSADDAPIKAEILINPLTPKEIQQTFINALKNKQKLANKDKNAVNNILDLLQTHPTLETVLCTPFYYNIALDVFEGRTKTYDLPNKQEDLERYLVEAFLDKKFEYTKNKLDYSEEKSRHYLSFVASVLEVENIKNFELVSFQPNHIPQKWLMNIIGSILYGLLLSILSIFNPIYALVGIAIIIKVISFNDNLYQEINTDYIGRFNWKNILNGSKILKSIGFGFGLGIFMFALFLLINTFYSIVEIYYLAMYIIPVISVLYLFYEEYKIISILNPYQKIVHETSESILFQLILLLPLLSFLSIIIYAYQNTFGLIAWLFFCLICTILLLSINTSLSANLILRIALFIQQKLPLRWVTFFTYATDARILEQDGGQWRFRHQILQDYFLEKWKEKN